MSEHLQIGELAGRAGVEVATLRYYERRGILAEPPRASSGYRHYPPEAVERVRFIRRARTLGFSLDDIQELIRLRSEATGASKVRDSARTRLEQIRLRIDQLRQMERDLSNLVDRCDGKGSGSDCVILQSMEVDR